MEYRTKWNLILFSPSYTSFFLKVIGILAWNWWIIIAIMISPIVFACIMQLAKWWRIFKKH